MNVGSIGKESLAAIAILFISGGMALASPLLEGAVPGGETLTQEQMTSIALGVILCIAGLIFWGARGIGKKEGWFDDEPSETEEP